MNGTVFQSFNWGCVRADVRKRLGVNHLFVVLYAGNLGLAQGLDHVLDAAATLASLQPDVLFLFLGSGPVKHRLEKTVVDRGLRNVRFLPRTTVDGAAQQMTAADALLVPLGDHPIYRKFIPSKLFDCMAAGRPVLLSVDGEARSILSVADAGIYYPAESADGLVNAVMTIKADPDSAARMGHNGRNYASAHCSREEQARIMARFIERIAKKGKESKRAGG